MNRRDFLRMAGALAAGAALSACGPTAPQVITQIVRETVEVTKIIPATPIVETKIVPATPAVTKVVETKVVEQTKIVEVTRVVQPAVKVTGTFWVLQKKDFFPDMNDWFRNEVLKFCKEKGWPVDISYEAGYTGGTPFLEKLAAAAAAGTPADVLMHSEGITELRRLLVIDPVTDLVEKTVAQWADPSARQKFDFMTEG